MADEKKVASPDQPGNRHPTTFKDTSQTRAFERDLASQKATVSQVETRVKPPADAVPPAK